MLVPLNLTQRVSVLASFRKHAGFFHVLYRTPFNSIQPVYSTTMAAGYLLSINEHGLPIIPSENNDLAHGDFPRCIVTSRVC